MRRILFLQERLSALTGGIVPALPPSYADAINSSSRATPKDNNVDTGTLQSGGLQLLGLDKLRELVLPDAIVGAISASVSMSVEGGRKVLAPLDPFADPTASLRAKPVGIGITQDDELGKSGEGHESEWSTRVRGRRREGEEQVQNLREEMDSLVASACILCDGSIQMINRPFIADPSELREWEL